MQNIQLYKLKCAILGLRDCAREAVVVFFALASSFAVQSQTTETILRGVPRYFLGGLIEAGGGMTVASASGVWQGKYPYRDWVPFDQGRGPASIRESNGEVRFRRLSDGATLFQQESGATTYVRARGEPWKLIGPYVNYQIPFVYNSLDPYFIGAGALWRFDRETQKPKLLYMIPTGSGIGLVGAAVVGNNTLVGVLDSAIGLTYRLSSDSGLNWKNWNEGLPSGERSGNICIAGTPAGDFFLGFDHKVFSRSKDQSAWTLSMDFTSERNPQYLDWQTNCKVYSTQPESSIVFELEDTASTSGIAVRWDPNSRTWSKTNVDPDDSNLTLLGAAQYSSIDASEIRLGSLDSGKSTVFYAPQFGGRRDGKRKLQASDAGVVVRRGPDTSFSRDSGKSWQLLADKLPTRVSSITDISVSGERAVVLASPPRSDDFSTVLGFESVDWVNWMPLSPEFLQQKGKLIYPFGCILNDASGNLIREYVAQDELNGAQTARLNLQLNDRRVYSFSTNADAFDGNCQKTAVANGVFYRATSVGVLEIFDRVSGTWVRRAAFAHPSQHTLLARPSGVLLAWVNDYQSQGQGGYRSVDAGLTWTKICDGICSFRNAGAAIFQLNHTTSKLTESLDDGQTWSTLNDVGFRSNDGLFSSLDTVGAVVLVDGTRFYDDTIDLKRFAPVKKVGVLVEYKNTLDFPTSPGGQFFYTDDPGEQNFLDSGGAGRFTRTGQSINTGGSRLACRFYGSVSPGPNSHFYTASQDECDAIRVSERFPRPSGTQQWNYEGGGFFVVPKTISGTCPTGSVPVYRAYNLAFSNGVKNPWNSNHRLTTDRATITQMTQLGWVDEGVVFCSPLS